MPQRSDTERLHPNDEVDGMLRVAQSLRESERNAPTPAEKQRAWENAVGKVGGPPTATRPKPGATVPMPAGTSRETEQAQRFREGDDVIDRELRAAEDLQRRALAAQAREDAQIRERLDAELGRS